MLGDDAPIDIIVGSQQRLLTETLYSSWAGPGAEHSFLAAANVGIFYLARRPPLVPDILLSLDIEMPANWWGKEHRSYFLWEFGKLPNVVIEIVSDKEGEEASEKKLTYARMRVPYYVIYDPQLQIMPDVLTVYRLQDFAYERQAVASFPTLGLGLILWEGRYEGKETTWLRWVDAEGALILSGKERAEAAELRERQTLERAKQAETLLAQERQRAERLAELLRQLGKDPTSL